MVRKKLAKIVLALIILTTLILMYSSIFKKEKIKKEVSKEEGMPYNSNIIENVNYSSKDAKGNEYIIDASQGEIDYSNSNVIFLTNVKAIIKLNNSKQINITSNYGRYNTNNFDTIFSKNVIVNYLENQITGEYLDFSMQRNSLIISRNVVYTNLENILIADVVEMNVETKDTKIFMFDNNKKVNIRSKDWYGNYKKI